MHNILIDAPTEDATRALGQALAVLLPAGAIVALEGPLGAGKTRLVQAICAAVGIAPETATSPTFVLMQEYQGTRTIVHVDAYRLRDEEEFLALGADELWESGAIVLVEWADRVSGCLPRERLRIAIRETGESSRRFEMDAVGEPYAAVIEGLAQWRRTANPR
ncbi:MAG: tRNA (adenosine(37)-N6)-threonylcarbamoyltransferase complex ATPase subunit type 1 TsaE [Planctomycetia bacterium]|nr:tRNA (adenosine(37)-N6)-threonylcarbamoyltransferase complex ATPase subunit type 1 TsaE [Planctomycetia bacterium]